MFKWLNRSILSIWYKASLSLGLDSKIRHKLFVMLLLLITIPFMFFAYFAVYKTSDYIYLESKHETVYFSTRLVHFIDHYYLRLLNQTRKQFSNYLFNREPDTSISKISKPLSQCFSSLSEIVAFSIHDQNRDVLVTYCTLTAQPKPPVYSTWRKINHPDLACEIVSPYYNVNYDKIILPIRFTLTDKTNQLYFVTVLFNLDHFVSVLVNWQIGDDTDLTIATVDGNIIIPLGLPANRPLAGLKSKLKPSNQSINIQLVKNAHKERSFLAYTRSTLFNWQIFIERKAHIATTLVNKLKVIMLLFAFSAILVALISSIFIVEKVVGPIEELESGIKLLENGLFVESLPVHSNDEIARLTMSFNQMAKTLTLRAEEVKNQNRKLIFFNEITRTINQNRNLHELLKISLDKIIGQLNATAGWIYTSDEQAGLLRCIVHKGLLSNPITELSPKSNPDHPIISVYTSGKTQAFRSDPTSMTTVSYDSIGTSDHHILLIPLRSQSKILGVLGIAGRTKRRFKFHDLDMISKIGDELGIALENTHLYSELNLKLRELEAVNKDLHDLDQLKNRILSNVSHELRTPITSIKTYVELFLNDKIGSLDELQKEKLVIVKRNINHLLTLIEDLLTLAKFQDQKMHLKHFEVVSLQDVVNEIIASTEELAKAKNLTLSKDMVKQTIMVRINRSNIIQVLQNLVANAIKFTEKGDITVRLKIDPASASNGIEKLPLTVRVEVEDTGIGIPQKLLPKIFRRFYQIDSSSTRKYVGTGLGLAIVKEILEAHRSEIQVKSELNQGTTFWFNLPIVNDINF